jgi:UTP:GlnB (protein PII) uridylyltransferase
MRPSGSLSTVSVTYFDRDGVRRAMAEYVQTLAAQHNELEEVVLFGSLASGTPVPGSDVDLLLILTSSDRPFGERIPLFLPGKFPVGVDVFPYTRAEVERMRQEGNPMISRALREGRTIFRRTAGADGPDS